MASTQSAPEESTLRPWQLFTLLALCAATVAVVIARGSSPANIILISFAIGAAAAVGLGALRTLRPLVFTDPYEPQMVGSRTRAALEREKNLLLRAIKELEFDHAMGKVSLTDFEEMSSRLRTRAVRLIQQLDSADSGYREILERELASRLGKAGLAAAARTTSAATEGQRAEGTEQRETGVCGVCETRNEADARFCKRCGSTLLMLLVAILSFAGPAFAQFQMPDPKQMSGIPRPVTDLPEGHISVRLIRGQLSNNIPNHPVELHAGSKVVTVKTDENGRAEFSGIAGGTPVKAVTEVDGERLESEEFPAPTQGGIRLMLVATAKGGEGGSTAAPPQTGAVGLGDETRIVIDIAADALQVYYLLDFQNPASAPVNPSSTVLMDLPAEAQGASVLSGAPQAIVRGSRLTVTGPFAPGQTAVQVRYQLPYSGGNIAIAQKLPLAVGHVLVLMRKLGDMSIASPQIAQQEEREYESDHYVLASGPAQAAGSVLTLNVAGLPHHSPTPRNVALALACGLVLTGVWFAVRLPRQGPSDASQIKRLKGKREKIFSELIRLEQQRQTEGLDVARYTERRQVLMAQLERVYRELDTEGGQGLAA